MDTQAEVVLTKHRRSRTHLGCNVDRKAKLNTKTGRVDEEIVLSHPFPIHEVAFSVDRILEMASWR